MKKFSLVALVLVGMILISETTLAIPPSKEWLKSYEEGLGEPYLVEQSGVDFFIELQFAIQWLDDKELLSFENSVKGATCFMCVHKILNYYDEVEYSLPKMDYYDLLKNSTPPDQQHYYADFEVVIKECSFIGQYIKDNPEVLSKTAVEIVVEAVKTRWELNPKK